MEQQHPRGPSSGPHGEPGASSAEAIRPSRLDWIPGRAQLPKGPLGAIDSATMIVVVTLLALVSAMLVAQVFARYIVGQSLVWSEELAVSLFVWIAMLGIALGVRRGEHLTLDLVSRFVRGRGKVIASIAICVLAVVTFLVIAFYCIKLLGPADRQTLAGIQSGLGIAAKTSWVYAAVPVGMILSAIFTVERLVLVLTGRVTVMSADADLAVIAELEAVESDPPLEGPAAGKPIGSEDSKEEKN